MKSRLRTIKRLKIISGRLLNNFFNLLSLGEPAYFFKEA